MSNEFYPIPDEFNLGYKPSKRLVEKRKERKWKLARKLKVLLTSTLLVMPLTINIGLWDIRSFEFGPGTYQYENYYVHFEDSKGWFFDGTYFIPMYWNEAANTYDAAGAFPETTEASTLDTNFYTVKASGDIEVTDTGVILLNPFTQEKELFTPANVTLKNGSAMVEDPDDGKNKVIDVTYIDDYNRHGLSFNGSWVGQFTPQYSYPMAYAIGMDFSGNTAEIALTDNVVHDIMTFRLNWTISRCVLTFNARKEVYYMIPVEDGWKNFWYDDTFYGILFFTEKGMYLETNVFTSQIFTKY